MPRLGWPILLALAACSATPSGRGISVEGYDRSCASVADCVPVVAAPVGCCDSACPNAAVSATAATTYEADRTAAETKACPGTPPCGANPGGPACPSARVACANGLCEVLVPDASTD
jgi:hypothetical protein